MRYERRRTVYLDDHGNAAPRDRAVWWETSYYDGRGKLLRREMGAMRPGEPARGGPAAAFDAGSKLVGLRGPGLGGPSARRARRRPKPSSG